MSQTNPDAAWARFQAELKTLREELAKQNAGAEIQASLETLGKTAEQVISKLGDAARDPGVRAGTTATARSFGLAVGETLRRIGDDLAQSFRERKP
jgi:predicted trehalose synthase